MSGVLESSSRRVLLVDNFDSYTGNLYQQIWEAAANRPIVVTNNQPLPASIDTDFTHIVIGPGPGSPYEPRDVGLLYELIARTRLPVLGVCLGHQVIAVSSGAAVRRSTRPQHGFVDEIHHSETTLFAGLPSPIVATRYHSLVVSETGDRVRVTARAGVDGAIMGIEVESTAMYGVQFHPESIGTPYGKVIMENFLSVDRMSVVARRVVGP